MIKAIIFDYFGVIGVSTYQMIVNDTVLNSNQKQELTDLHRAFDHGFMSEVDFMKDYAKILNISNEEFINKYYKATSKFEVSKQLLKLSTELRKNYKVAILSNVGEDSYKQFIKPIEQNFDIVVTSFQSKLAKPDAAIYEYTASQLGVLPSECVMIDDTFNNCEGALTAGMQAIHYTDYEEFYLKLQKLLADFNS